MTLIRYVLSQEERESSGLVAFSGFVHSCRNLGHVTFFLLQDLYGLIQIVWQRSILETKLTDQLIGKRVDVLGILRRREQKATSLINVNNILEIEATDCFLVDKEKRRYSLFSDVNLLLFCFKEGEASFLKKEEGFERKISNANLLLQLSDWMRKKGYWETSLGELNGSARTFQFRSTPSLFEMNMIGPVFSSEELLSQGEELFQFVLRFYGYEEPKSIDTLSKEKCLEYYGSLEPDFRFSFQIEHSNFYLDTDRFGVLVQNGRCLVIPGLEKSFSHIEKIITFVKEQIGLTISYLVRKEGLTVGPLQAYAHPYSSTDHVLFFAWHEDLNRVQTALATISIYLQEHSLCQLANVSAKWIVQEDFEVSRYFLLFNGQKIGDLSLKKEKEPFCNQGLMAFDFSALQSKRKKGKEKRKSVPTYSAPLMRFSLSVGKEALEKQIAENDLFEKEQVREILNLLDGARNLSDKIEAITPSLARFSMKKEDAFFLISLLPNRKEAIQDFSEQECFQFLWSLLGHKHVVEVLQSEDGRLALQSICSLNIVSDYKQLLFFDLRTVLLISSWIKDQVASLETLLKVLKTVLNSAPNDFSNLMECLDVLIQDQVLFDEKLIVSLLRVSKMGFSTPIFFSFYRKHQQQTSQFNEMGAVLRSLSSLIFPNISLDPHQIADLFVRLLKEEVFNSQQLFSEIVYYLFKPLNMSFLAFAQYLLKVPDRTSDIAANLSFEGKNWDPIERCYSFDQEKHSLHIYPSKNKASFFAKASAGICTGIDLSLFEREDHIHLNLVSSKEKKVIGNVQAYLLQVGGKQSLLIRGVNPSASYLNEDNFAFILNMVLESAVQMANSNKIEQVLLCPSLGIWHVESSRRELIGAIQLLCKELPVIPLDKPFLLFHFASQDKEISFAYLVWDQFERPDFGQEHLGEIISKIDSSLLCSPPLSC